MRVYGSGYGTDSHGKFILVELKYGLATLRRGQVATFRLIDATCRRGDPHGRRYRGYYLLQYSDEDWAAASFCVNGVTIDREQLARFLQLDETMLDLIATKGTPPV